MSEVPAKPPLRRSNGLIAGVAVGVIAAAAAIYLISDRGRKEEAKKLLDQVVSEAPQFSLAKSDLNALLQ